MMKSYGATPEPCTTFEIMFEKHADKLKRVTNNTLRINVKFPVRFKEIKEEKVR